MGVTEICHGEANGTRTLGIVAQGLSKCFGSRFVVSELSFEAPAGSITALVGDNGSGKTTTLRMILNLVRPSAGTVTINGSSYVNIREPARTVGAVLDSTCFAPKHSLRHQLTYAALTCGADMARVDALIHDLQLEDFSRHRVGMLSRGVMQRFRLACALLGDPQILVLDEPSTALDQHSLAWLHERLRQFQAEDKTVLMASHSRFEIDELADNVVELVHGRLAIDAATGNHGGAVSLRPFSAMDRDTDSVGAGDAEAASALAWEADR